MKCTECGLLIPYSRSRKIAHCTSCGIPLVPDVTDILKNGKYDIVREFREPQLDMGTMIEDAFAEEKSTLLIEGGTGLGKSFAYLLPALLKEKVRVVVSTAKKTLQAQLVNKDIPYLLDKMESDKSVVLYKGKNNYGCWKMESRVPEWDRERYRTFILKARSDSRPADLADWDGPRPNWWDSISIENCALGTNCPHHSHCIPRIRQHSVVVTNHHLLALDLRLTPGSLLGEYQVLIVDEAHLAHKALQDAYTRTISEKGLTRIISGLRKNTELREVINSTGVTTAKQITEVLENTLTCYKLLHKAAEKFADDTGIYPAEKVNKPLANLQEASSVFNRKLFNVTQVLEKARLASNASDESEKNRQAAMLGALKNLSNSMNGVARFIEETTMSNPDPTKNHGGYISIWKKECLTLTPLTVGKLVSPPLNSIPHKVFVSATLAINGSFADTITDLGLQDSANISTKIYPGSFNIDRQAILYMPTHLPPPARANTPDRGIWISTVGEEIIKLVEIAGGDTFVLFTARTDMTEMAEYVQGRVASLITQDGDAEQTLKKYLETAHSTLFGLKSFWEGVDIPGNKLKLVVIPKLPFPNPFDPIIAGLNRIHGKQSFQKVSLPAMLWDVKQGAGRLLRTANDRGTIAILDPRAWTGKSQPGKHAALIQRVRDAKVKTQYNYGRTLINAIGYKNRITPDIDVYAKFMSKFFPD